FVSAPLDPLFPPSIRVVQQSFQAPRKLLVASSLNAHHTLTVSWAVFFRNGPFPIYVPFVVRRDVTPLAAGLPQRASSHTMVYTYTGGSFDPTEREFAGFSTVIATGPPWGTTTQT